MHESEWLNIVTRHDPWDAVVLGAGPAGTIAARQLALGGYSVLLVEKSRFPRFKVCGGCLGGAALDVLEEVGLGHLPEACDGVWLNRMRLASNRNIAEITVGRRIAVARDRFDAALALEATRSGATFCTETIGTLHPAAEAGACSLKLRHLGDEAIIRAKVAFAATGLSSCPPHCTTQAEKKSRIGLGIVLKSTPGGLDPHTLYMACGQRGYVGIAAVSGGRLDIAAAAEPAALAAAHSPGRLLNDILKKAGLSPIDGLEAAAWHGTPLLTRQTRPLAANRCLLIGDAAGYVEPFTGEGIGWAMRSALLASSLVQQGIDVWDDTITQRWTRLYADTLLQHHRRCRLITGLLRHNVLRNCAVWSLRRAPYLARPLVQRLDQ